MAKQRSAHWEELTALVQQDDGLRVRKTGPWTFDKLWWWDRYIVMATTAMIGNPQWPSVVYVDLFAGPGVCQLRKSGERLPGSALIAAHAPKPFSRLILCESDPLLADACRSRLKSHGAADRSVVITGDCNEQIHEIVQHIPDRALSLAFVDPTGLHVDLSTLQTLTTGRRVDLVILFADYMDIVRNVKQYAEQEQSNLDRMLGVDSRWRDEWNALDNQTPFNVARLFSEIYKRQLADKLGYTYSDSEVVLKNSAGDSIYRLVFASKHSRGLDFWQKATKEERSHNRLF